MAIKDSMIGYERANKANRLTMEHYFKDPNWFDNVDFFEDRRAKKFAKTTNKNKIGIQPMRCIKCKLPFQKLSINRNGRTHIHLNRSLFDGIVLEKGICHGCK